MAGLKEILSWFEKNKYPTQEQFKESWTSFWHKSEKMPMEQVVGLQDELSDKATKSTVEAIEADVAQRALKSDLNAVESELKEDIANVVSGLVPMGSVPTLADLDNKHRRNNDSYYVEDQLNENGDAYIYRWDEPISQWVNTKQVVFKDVAKKTDIDHYNVSSLFPTGGTSHNNVGVGPYYIKKDAIEKLMQYLPKSEWHVGLTLTYSEKYGYPKTIIYTGGSFDRPDNWVASALSAENDGYVYGGFIYKKSIIETDVPTFFIPAESGTYINQNNIYVDVDIENVILVKKGTIWEKKSAPFYQEKTYKYKGAEFEIFDLETKRDLDGNLLFKFSLISWSNLQQGSTSKPQYDDTVNTFTEDNYQWVVLSKSEVFCYDFKRDLFTVVANNKLDSNTVISLVGNLNQDTYIFPNRNIYSDLKKINNINTPLIKTDIIWEYSSVENKIIEDLSPATDFTSYEPILVKEGDNYIITNGSGGEFYKRWTITDNDNNVLSKSSFSTLGEKYIEYITIPEFGTKMYITTRSNFVAKHGNPSVEKTRYSTPSIEFNINKLSIPLRYEGGWIQSKDSLDANYGILFDYRTAQAIVCDKITKITVEKPIISSDEYKSYIHFYDINLDVVKVISNQTNEYPFNALVPKNSKYFRICHDQDRNTKDTVNVPFSDLNPIVKLECLDGWRYDEVSVEKRLNEVIQLGWKYNRRASVSDVVVDNEANPVKYMAQEIANRGIIQLPINYKNTGEPTRLIIFAHGSGNPFPTNFSPYDKYVNYLVAEGYAVADCRAWGYTSDRVTSNIGTQFMNTPSNYQSYSSFYYYLIGKYNLKKDGVFMFGKSQGALTPFGMPYVTNIPILAACSLAGAGTPMLTQYGYHNPDRIACMSDFGFSGMEMDENGNLIGEAKCMLKKDTSDYAWTEDRIKFMKKNLHNVAAYDPLFQSIINVSHDKLFEVIATKGILGESEWRALKPVKTFKVPFIIFVAKDDAGIYFENIIHKIAWDNSGSLCVIRRMPINSGDPHHAVDTAGPFIERITTELGINFTNIPIAYIEMLQFFKEFE